MPHCRLARAPINALLFGIARGSRATQIALVGGPGWITSGLASRRRGPRPISNRRPSDTKLATLGGAARSVSLVGWSIGGDFRDITCFASDASGILLTVGTSMRELRSFATHGAWLADRLGERVGRDLTADECKVHLPDFP